MLGECMDLLQESSFTKNTPSTEHHVKLLIVCNENIFMDYLFTCDLFRNSYSFNNINILDCLNLNCWMCIASNRFATNSNNAQQTLISRKINEAF